MQLFVVAVRQKVKELTEFVKDDEKLREERKKAKKNKDKYVGMSGLSASMHYGKTVAVTCNVQWTCLCRLCMLLDAKVVFIQHYKHWCNFEPESGSTTLCPSTLVFVLQQPQSV